MRICEIWQKGHPTRNQVYQSAKHVFGNRANVTTDRTDDSVQVQLYFHTFIDVFTQDGMSDKLLTMHAKWDNLRDSNYDSDQIRQALNKLDLYFRKIYKIAIRNSRSFVPHGWLLKCDFGNYGLLSFNNQITLNIIRDNNPISTHKDTFYHLTLSKNLPSILSNGIVPGSNDRIGFHGYRNRIYLFKHNPKDVDVDMVMRLVTNGNWTVSEKDLDTNIALLKVKLNTDKNTPYVDPEYSTYGIYIEQPIPASDISVLYNSTLRDFIK